MQLSCSKVAREAGKILSRSSAASAAAVVPVDVQQHKAGFRVSVIAPYVTSYACSSEVLWLVLGGGVLSSRAAYSSRDGVTTDGACCSW